MPGVVADEDRQDPSSSRRTWRGGDNALDRETVEVGHAVRRLGATHALQSASTSIPLRVLAAQARRREKRLLSCVSFVSRRLALRSGGRNGRVSREPRRPQRPPAARSVAGWARYRWAWGCAAASSVRPAALAPSRFGRLAPLVPLPLTPCRARRRYVDAA
eukprot:2840492-Prymnesium_polylepis.2